jgi:hypothetical protein
MPELIETIEDGIATLTFNRPERMNALSMPIMQGLLDGLPRLARKSCRESDRPDRRRSRILRRRRRQEHGRRR